MPPLPDYVLVTPAWNEAQTIELTIKSVVAQTVRPVKWVIVSDGSTDGMEEVVKPYAANHSWIELVQLPDRHERNFAGKVHAFNAGYARLRGIAYEAIASLDADISFDQNYFAYLLQKLTENPSLGLVGTPFKEEGTPVYDYRFVNIEHVSGACQLFRRECFEEIGGYVPVRGGCIDHIAVISSRMKGWKTRTFTDKVCVHHRPMGTAQQSMFEARFKNGAKDYAIGNHPVWELFRTAYQMSRPPLIIGGLAVASGYLWALLRGAERPVTRELVAFVRREQMQRLRKLLTGGQSAQTNLPASPNAA
jgi:poly-beta-1,6-N-acetyl-D-glucosamine synthase